MVEVVTTKVSVTVSRFYFKYTIAEFEDRDIECTTTEVEYCDFLVFVDFVKTIRKSRSSRFVYDTFYCKTSDFASFFCRLTLSIVEVSRNCDDCFSYSLTKIVFGSFLHFLKSHSRDFLSSIFATINVNTRSVVVATYHLVRDTFYFFCYIIISFTHETLDRIDSAFRVSDCLAFSRVTYFAFATVNKCYYRRSSVATFAVRDNNRVVTFENSYT